MELEILGSIIDALYWCAIGLIFCQWALKCSMGFIQYKYIFLGFAPIFVFGLGVPMLIQFLHQINFAKLDEIRCSVVGGMSGDIGALTMTSCDGWILFGSTFGDFATKVTRVLFHTGFWEKTNLTVITYVVGTWFATRLLSAAFDFTAKSMVLAIGSSLLIAFVLANSGTIAGFGNAFVLGFMSAKDENSFTRSFENIAAWSQVYARANDAANTGFLPGSATLFVLSNALAAMLFLLSAKNFVLLLVQKAVLLSLPARVFFLAVKPGGSALAPVSWILGTAVLSVAMYGDLWCLKHLPAPPDLDGNTILGLFTRPLDAMLSLGGPIIMMFLALVGGSILGAIGIAASIFQSLSMGREMRSAR